MEKTKSESKTDKKAAAAKPASKTHPQKKMLTSTPVLVFVVLVVLLYSVWNSYQFSQNQQQQATLGNKTQQQLSNLDQEINQTSAMQQAMQAQLQDINRAQQQQQELMEQYAQGLSRALQRVQSKSEDFQLEEVLALVKQARIQLLWRHSPGVAIRLLQLADEELKTMANPRYLPIRKALARDMVSLSAVPALDKQGLLAKLNAFQQQIPQLPIIGNTTEGMPAMDNDDQQQTDTEQAWWQQGLHRTWQKLQHVVVVRKRDAAIEPLMTKEQQRILTQHCQLLLQQAEWALINQDQAVYANSLQQAIEHLKQHFNADDQRTRSLMSALQQLSMINVAPELPDIIQTQEIIQQTINSRANTTNQQQEQ